MTCSRKVTGCLILLILIMSISAGCTSATPTHSPGSIVSCSNYRTVTDDYITPDGRYVVIEGYSGRYLVKNVDLDISGNLTGRSVECQPLMGQPLMGCDLINLTILSENETGMRDACRVEP